jgi:hypothetical protein
MTGRPAEFPEHELEGWQRGNRLELHILCELGQRYPGIVQPTGPVRRSRPECPARSAARTCD